MDSSTDDERMRRRERRSQPYQMMDVQRALADPTNSGPSLDLRRDPTLTTWVFERMATVGDFPELQEFFCKLPPGRLDDAMNLVPDCFSKLTALRVLDIQAGECGVEERHLEPFFAALQRVPQLQVLRLNFSNNELAGTSPTTWKAVVAGITACSELTKLVLNLAGNDVCDSFLEALAGGGAGKEATGIGCLRDLVACEVNLGDSDLKGEHLQKLATAMSTCSKLKEIKMILNDNEIMGQHAEEFLAKFESSACVEDLLLDLRDNSIQEDFHRIVNGSKVFKPQALLRINCGGNDITEEQADEARHDCARGANLELTVDGDLPVQVSSSGSSDSGSLSVSQSDSRSSSVAPLRAESGTPDSFASGDSRDPANLIADSSSGSSFPSDDEENAYLL